MYEKDKDKNACFRLNPFHRNKAVREKVHNRKAVFSTMELFGGEKIGERSVALSVTGAGYAAYF